MRKLGSKIKTPLGISIIATLLLVVVGGIACLISFSNPRNNHSSIAKGNHLVTIHDRGVDKTIVTKASTVGSALKEAGVILDNKDIVEPTKDEKMTASQYQVNIYRARPVVVVDGNTRDKIMTPYQTAAQIAKSAGITVYDEDITTVTRSDDASDGAGLKLTIKRATPFIFTLYGNTFEARTQGKTVGAMLKEKGVKLGKDDRVSLATSTPITKDMSIRVWREGKQTITVTEPVAYETETIQDANQKVGYSLVKTPGVNGEQNVTYEIVIQDGKEVSRTKINSIVTKQPVPEVEVVGTMASFSGSFSQALAKLRACEAGGSYTRNSGNGYYGAYQYDKSTWGGYGGYTYASDAPASVQDQRAWETYQSRGWSPWPVCGSSLPDSYR